MRLPLLVRQRFRIICVQSEFLNDPSYLFASACMRLAFYEILGLQLLLRSSYATLPLGLFIFKECCCASLRNHSLTCKITIGTDPRSPDILFPAKSEI